MSLFCFSFHFCTCCSVRLTNKLFPNIKIIVHSRISRRFTYPDFIFQEEFMSELLVLQESKFAFSNFKFVGYTFLVKSVFGVTSYLYLNMVNFHGIVFRVLLFRFYAMLNK